MRSNVLRRVPRILALTLALGLAAVFLPLTTTAAPQRVGSASATAARTAVPSFDRQLFDMLPPQIQSSKTISFGALWETPPVIGVSPSNPSVPVGLAPDLAAAVAKVLGVHAQWKNLQWPAQLPGLQSGNIDVLWGQVSDSKEREQSVADLIAFMQEPWSLLLPAGNPHHVTSFANACGMKIAVPNGSEQDAIVDGNSKLYCTSKGKPAISKVEYPGAQEAIVALKSGTVDAWLNDVASNRTVVKSAPSTYTTIQLPNNQTDPYASNITTVAVGKANPGLTRAIAGALHVLAKDGIYQKLMKKWGVPEATLAVNKIKINTYTNIPPGKK